MSIRQGTANCRQHAEAHPSPTCLRDQPPCHTAARAGHRHWAGRRAQVAPGLVQCDALGVGDSDLDSATIANYVLYQRLAAMAGNANAQQVPWRLVSPVGGLANAVCYALGLQPGAEGA